VYGWLSWLNESTVVRWATGAPWLDFGGRAFTLLVESAGLVILLFGRRGTLTILVGCIIMHLGIFASSGILFWIWTVADVLLFVVVWRSNIHDPMYDWRMRLASVTIIAWSALNPFPLKFGWYDSRVVDRFALHGENSRGDVGRLHPHEFAPYDMTFGFGRFGMLTQRKTLVGTYGTTYDFKLYRLLEATTAKDIRSVYETHAVSRFDAESTDRFVDAVRRFLVNKQRGAPGIFVIIDRIAAPFHFWGSVPGSGSITTQEVRRVRVYLESYYHTPESIRPLQNEPVLEINLQEGRPVTRSETRIDSQCDSLDQAVVVHNMKRP
jgi:hypothetical protein